MEPVTSLRAARPAAAGTAPVRGPAPAQVHVWYLPLLDLARRAAQLRDLLPPQELAAAQRPRTQADRLRFVCRRAAVRAILGRYVGLAPRDLRFHENEQGKPELAGAAARSGIQFNVSRTDDLAVCAVTGGHRIGVDLEVVRPIEDALDIARAYFSPAEHRALCAVPPGDRALAFLQCWTRKEAFVKAHGAGLSYPLHDFDVTLAPDEPAALLRVGGDPQSRHHWSMTSLEPPGAHVGALVVARPACEVSASRWWFGDAT